MENMNEEFDFETRFKSLSFISWAPFLIYQMTGLSYGYQYLWELRFKFSGNGDGGIIALIYGIYLFGLFYFSPEIDKLFFGKISNNQKLALFHGLLIGLLIIVSSFFHDKHFDLLLKLGCIGCLAGIQWFLHAKEEIPPQS